MRILNKYAQGKTVSNALSSINVILANEKSNQLHEHLVKVISALTVFDQLDTALEQLASRSPALCKSAVNDTVSLLSLAIESSTTNDIQPLHQLVQIVSINNFHKSSIIF
jgi:predicted component of type VI protein secretion system